MHIIIVVTIHDYIPCGFCDVLLGVLVNRITTLNVPQRHIFVLRGRGFLKGEQISATRGQNCSNNIRNLKGSNLLKVFTIIYSNKRVRFHDHKCGPIITEFGIHTRDLVKLNTRLSIGKRGPTPDRQVIRRPN